MEVPQRAVRRPRRGTDGERGPEQFLWRGRLWKVRAVLAHWVETGSVVAVHRGAGRDRLRGARPPRCRPTAAGDPAGDLLAERELWRVEAGRGRSTDGGGVFDLSFDWADGRWQLVGCAD